MCALHDLGDHVQNGTHILCCTAKQKGSICLLYKLADTAFWLCTYIPVYGMHLDGVVTMTGSLRFHSTTITVVCRYFVVAHAQWSPCQTRRRTNVQRWTNINSTLIQRLMFSRQSVVKVINFIFTQRCYKVGPGLTLQPPVPHIFGFSFLLTH